MKARSTDPAWRGPIRRLPLILIAVSIALGPFVVASGASAARRAHAVAVGVSPSSP